MGERDAEVRSGPPGGNSISTGMLERVKSQEPEAWERLVALYGPVVYRCSRQEGLGAEDAADVVQEVFGAVSRRVGNFRRDQRGQSFRSWLWAIMRNKIRDHYRRCRKRPEARGGSEAQRQFLQVPDMAHAAPHHDESDSDSALTHRALESLQAEFEDRTWRAFWRAAVDGQAPVHIAEDLGMTLHAVYKAKSRVLCRLRLRYGDLIE